MAVCMSAHLDDQTGTEYTAALWTNSGDRFWRRSSSVRMDDRVVVVRYGPWLLASLPCSTSEVSEDEPHL